MGPRQVAAVPREQVAVSRVRPGRWRRPRSRWRRRRRRGGRGRTDGWRRRRGRAAAARHWLGARCASGEDSAYRPAGGQQQAHNDEADGDRKQPLELDSHPHVGIDATAAVSVHDDDGPVAALDVPLQLGGLRRRDLRYPKRLVTGRRCFRLAFLADEHGHVLVVVEVIDAIAGDRAEGTSPRRRSGRSRRTSPRRWRPTGCPTTPWRSRPDR